jgi:hypothetical protein
MHVFLLDKSVARRTVEAFRFVRERRPISREHGLSLAFWHTARQIRYELYVVPKTSRVLERLATLPEVALFAASVAGLYPGPYVKRWARRLRARSFGREDATVLSLATFGTNALGTLLGVEAVVTLDRAMIRNYEHRCDELGEHLSRMTGQLAEPFCYAQLPEVWQPGQALTMLVAER